MSRWLPALGGLVLSLAVIVVHTVVRLATVERELSAGPSRLTQMQCIRKIDRHGEGRVLSDTEGDCQPRRA